MEPANRDASSVAQLWRSILSYPYLHSRAQFHPAVYVLQTALIITVVLSISLWAIGFVITPRHVVDYELVVAFTACLVAAELTRGHVRHWLGVPPGEWCFKSITAGGAALGMTLWAIVLLRSPSSRWHELPAFVAFGAAAYLVLGYLFRYEERKKLREHHDT